MDDLYNAMFEAAWDCAAALVALIRYHKAWRAFAEAMFSGTDTERIDTAKEIGLAEVYLDEFPELKQMLES